MHSDNFSLLAGHGLNANYYLGSQYKDLISQGTVNNAEITGSPIPQIPESSAFMVRWSGFIFPPETVGDQYLLRLTNDADRVRVWIDYALVIDQWTSLGLGQNCILCFATEFGTNGEPSRIEVHYKHGYGIPASLSTSLRHSDGTTSKILSTQLFPKTSNICGSPFTVKVIPGKKA